MPTFVVLTRLTPETVPAPADLAKLEKAVADRIRKECPEVKWVANYAILGPCDYLDVFEAPSEVVAAKAVMIIRSFGRAQTETWTALPWERFRELIPSSAGSVVLSSAARASSTG
jgi:uncharacterized protein with GYD domain